MLDIRIDHDVCAGTQACHQWLPDVFGLDEDGLGIVLDPNAAPEDEIISCAMSCPTAAIHVERDGKPVGE
jgi:ferredoxin